MRSLSQAAPIDPDSPPPDASARPLLFSIKCYLAAVLALYVALALHLQRLYWAVLTTYITAQPYSAAVRSKAVFRLGGTVAGLVAALVLVPALVDSPELLCTALAAWIGSCLYISLLDRTPRSYAFRLAGYTAGLIAFPSVIRPDTLFLTALARTEEIGLGVICAALTHSLILPQSLAPMVRWRIQKLTRSFETTVAEGLSHSSGETASAERAQMSAAMTDLHLLATHLPYEIADRNLNARNLQALQDRLALLLPTLEAVEDRLTALGQHDDELAALLENVAEWARADSAKAPERARELISGIEQRVSGVLGSPGRWQHLLELSLLVRLRETVELLGQAREWSRHLLGHSPRTPVPARPPRPLHVDHGQAAMAGFAAAVAVIACCIFWIETAWPQGAIAAMIAGVFASLFASMDDPTPAIRQMYRFVLASVPLAAFYEFAVLPSVDGFPQLVMALAPLFISIGFLLALPDFSARAMPLLIGLVPSLSLTAHYNNDFTGFLNSNIAQLFGAVAALSSVGLLSAMGAREALLRLMKLTARDLADLSSGRRSASRSHWTSRMLDRIGLMLPRLSAASDLAGIEPWRDLRMGLSIIDLRNAESRMNEPDRLRMERIRATLATHFRSQGNQPVSARVLEEIRGAAEQTLSSTTPELRRDTALALVSLYRNLPRKAPP